MSLKNRNEWMLTGLAALLLLGATAAVAQAQTKRLVWSYEGGFFEDRGLNRWVEKNSTGTYYFKEADRNGDFIELYDGSRNCTVRLYSDTMYLKGLGRFPDFVKFYNGRWSR